jgi:hypothetical protein
VAIADPPPSLPILDRSVEERQLQVHLYEYNALATRLTYWITLQYATYALAAGSLGFIAQAWGHIEPRLLACASLLIQLILLWALVQTTYEIYTYVVYIETDLRPRISRLVDSHCFWRFEKFLSVERRNRFISYEQTLGLFPLFACGICAALFVIVQYSLPNWRSSLFSDGIWGGCSFYVAIMTALKQRHVAALQRKVAALVDRCSEGN